MYIYNVCMYIHICIHTLIGYVLYVDMFFEYIFLSTCGERERDRDGEYRERERERERYRVAKTHSMPYL